MDTCGNWICGFSVLLGTCITIEAEIWALVHGLRMAWEKGIRRLVVEMDSMLVHAWVTNKNPKHRRHATLLKGSADFLSRDWNVQVHHIHREWNQAADYLANLSMGRQNGEVSF